jgi:hypothetical protein
MLGSNYKHQFASASCSQQPIPSAYNFCGGAHGLDISCVAVRVKISMRSQQNVPLEIRANPTCQSWLCPIPHIALRAYPRDPTINTARMCAPLRDQCGQPGVMRHGQEQSGAFALSHGGWCSGQRSAQVCPIKIRTERFTGKFTVGLSFEGNGELHGARSRAICDVGEMSSCGFAPLGKSVAAIRG